MDLQLKNKIAFISGSTAGIGFAIAKALLKERANVIINGRSQENIDKAIEQLKVLVPAANISGILADFRIAGSINAIVDSIDHVDILINNVGIYASKTFEETTSEDWHAMFDVNVMSGVNLSKYFLPKMKTENWGRIIFISSECAQLVPEDLIAYSATKAALQGVSRGLAQTTKGTRVTVNTLIPGSTLTEGARKFLKDRAKTEKSSEDTVASDFFKTERSTSIIERFAEPDEIAAMAVFIASPLSSATNGAAIKVDGGSVPGIF